MSYRHDRTHRPYPISHYFSPERHAPNVSLYPIALRRSGRERLIEFESAYRGCRNERESSAKTSRGKSRPKFA